VFYYYGIKFISPNEISWIYINEYLICMLYLLFGYSKIRLVTFETQGYDSFMIVKSH